MENKINIVELLKDCPKGMELYSPIYGLGILIKVTDRIHVKFPKEHNVKCFRPDGKVSEDGEIMLYPKDKTTWEGFQRPFKDGDILSYQCEGLKNRTIYIYMYHNIMNTTYYVALSGHSSEFLTNCTKGCALNGYNDTVRFATEEEKKKLFDAIKENGYKWNPETKTLEIMPKFNDFEDGDICYIKTASFKHIFIFKDIEKHHFINRYINLSGNRLWLYTDEDAAVCTISDVEEFRLATEEEKQKLFQAIKDKGYAWNPKTKTLEKLVKPKFKAGDRIRHIVGREEFATVVSVEELHYNLDSKVGTSSFSISLQHEWELVPNKFDINTLKPFDKVLCRDSFEDIWTTGFYSHYETKELSSYYVVNGTGSDQCIPYNEETKHLIGTNNDCDGFYKTWEE